MTVSELLYEWMEKEQRERIRAQTYARYMGLIELHIIPKIGEEDIATLTRRQISDLLNEKRHIGNQRYEGGLSPISVNLMLSILNMAYEYAFDCELTESNPCDRVRRIPAVDRKHSDAFTKEEQRLLEQTIEAEDDDRLFGIVLCFYTGLRIGELLALEWTDINGPCDILTISKTVYRSKNENGDWQLCVHHLLASDEDRTEILVEHFLNSLPEWENAILCALLKGQSKAEIAREHGLTPYRLKRLLESLGKEYLTKYK